MDDAFRLAREMRRLRREQPAGGRLAGDGPLIAQQSAKAERPEPEGRPLQEFPTAVERALKFVSHGAALH
jgi:hypothetical protein